MTEALYKKKPRKWGCDWNVCLLLITGIITWQRRRGYPANPKPCFTTILMTAGVFTALAWLARNRPVR